MVKAVKITTDNRISVVELPSWSLEAQEKEIGADCTETVKTQIMYNPIYGDVLFGVQRGPDILPLENPELVKFFLKDHFKVLQDAEDSRGGVAENEQ